MYINIHDCVCMRARMEKRRSFGGRTKKKKRKRKIQKTAKKRKGMIAWNIFLFIVCLCICGCVLSVFLFILFAFPSLLLKNTRVEWLVQCFIHVYMQCIWTEGRWNTFYFNLDEKEHFYILVCDELPKDRPASTDSLTKHTVQWLPWCHLTKYYWTKFFS